MIYRSTNPEGYVHFGGDIMSGAQSTRGVLLSSNTISPVSDNSNEDLVLKGKGTGGVVLGSGSTTAIVGIVAGESTVTIPALAATAQGESTFTATGISTGDLVLSVDFRNAGSTAYVFGSAYVGAANKIHVHTANVHASTISASTGTTVRWAYLDRT
jgi:hypothetical protein